MDRKLSFHKNKKDDQSSFIGLLFCKAPVKLYTELWLDMYTVKVIQDKKNPNKIKTHNQSQFLWLILSWSETQPMSTQVLLLWQPLKRPSYTGIQMSEVDFLMLLWQLELKFYISPSRSDFFLAFDSSGPAGISLQSCPQCVPLHGRCVCVCVPFCSKAESQTPSKLSLAWCATPITEVEIIGYRINTPLSLSPPLSFQPPSLMLHCHLINSQ